MANTPQNIENLTQKFMENGYLEADMSLQELKKFLRFFSYEIEDWTFDPIGSNVQIGTCGGVKYFTPEGREIIIAFNDEPCPPYNDFPREVIEWLIQNEIPFYF